MATMNELDLESRTVEEANFKAGNSRFSLWSSVMATMNIQDLQSPTVGEANLKAGNDRCSSWTLAVFFVSVSFMAPMGITFILYANTLASLWRLVPLIVWGVYMTLVSVIVMHVNLDLPRTPVAVQEAILETGWGYIGFPLLCVVLFVVCIGHFWWMAVTLVFVLVIVIFNTIAFWARLVRTYRK